MAAVKLLLMLVVLYINLVPNEVAAANKNSGFNFDDGFNFGEGLADLVGSYLQDPGKIKNDFDKIVKPFADAMTGSTKQKQPSQQAKSKQSIKEKRDVVTRTVVCKPNNKEFCLADLPHVIDELYAENFPESYRRLDAPTCKMNECYVVLKRQPQAEKPLESIKKQTDIFDVIKDAQEIYQDMISGRSFNYVKVLTLLDFLVDNPGADQLLLTMLDNFSTPQIPTHLIKSILSVLLEGYKKLKDVADVSNLFKAIQNMMSFDKLTDKNQLKSFISMIEKTVGSTIDLKRYQKSIELIVDLISTSVKSIGGEFVGELMAQGSYHSQLDYVKNLIFTYPWKEIDSIFLKYKSLLTNLADMKKKLPNIIDKSPSSQAERLAGLERKIASFIKSFENVSREIRIKLKQPGSNFIKEMSAANKELQNLLKEMKQISKLIDEKLEVTTNVKVLRDVKDFSRLIHVELNRWTVALKIHESSFDVNSYGLEFWGHVRTFLTGISKFKYLLDVFDAIMQETFRLLRFV